MINLLIMCNTAYYCTNTASIYHLFLLLQIGVQVNTVRCEIFERDLRIRVSVDAIS